MRRAAVSREPPGRPSQRSCCCPRPADPHQPVLHLQCCRQEGGAGAGQQPAGGHGGPGHCQLAQRPGGLPGRLCTQIHVSAGQRPCYSGPGDLVAAARPWRWYTMPVSRLASSWLAAALLAAPGFVGAPPPPVTRPHQTWAWHCRELQSSLTQVQGELKAAQAAADLEATTREFRAFIENGEGLPSRAVASLQLRPVPPPPPRRRSCPAPSVLRAQLSCMKIESTSWVLCSAASAAVCTQNPPARPPAPPCAANQPGPPPPRLLQASTWTPLTAWSSCAKCCKTCTCWAAAQPAAQRLRRCRRRAASARPRWERWGRPAAAHACCGRAAVPLVSDLGPTPRPGLGCRLTLTLNP